MATNIFILWGMNMKQILKLGLFAVVALFPLVSCNKEDKPDDPIDPVVTKTLKYTANSLEKTSYYVGEAFSTKGLEVKLFTTTDGVSDSGVVYSDYKLSIDDGYIFKSEDISTDVDPYELIITPNDTTFKPITIDLSVGKNPDDVDEVTVTPFEFISSLIENENYSVKNEYFNGRSIKDAFYWEDLGSSGQDAYTGGFAQRKIQGDDKNKEIIFYNITSEGKYIVSDGPYTTYTDMYSEEFQDAMFAYDDGFKTNRAVNNVKIITKDDLAYLKTLTKDETTGEYVVNSTYARNIIAMTTSAKIPLKTGFNKLYSNAKAKLTMLTNTSMKIDISGVGDMTTLGLCQSTVIDSVGTTSIEEIKPFLDGGNGEEDKETTEKNAIQNSLMSGNFSFVELDSSLKETSYNGLYNSPKYLYVSDESFINNAINLKDVRYDFTLVNKGTEEETDYEVVLGEALKDTNFIPGLSNNKIFNSLKDLAKFDKANSSYYIDIDETLLTNAQELSYLFTNKNKDAKFTKLIFTPTMEGATLTSLNLEFVLDSANTTFAKIDSFGSTYNAIIDTYYENNK